MIEKESTDSRILYEINQEIEIYSNINDNKIIVKCSYTSNRNFPCNGNLFLKEPDSQQVEKLYIDSEDFTYSFRYTSYGNYEIYYSNSSTCELPNAVGKPHDAVYPIHVVETKDPFIYVSNEYELIETLEKIFVMGGWIVMMRRSIKQQKKQTSNQC